MLFFFWRFASNWLPAVCGMNNANLATNRLVPGDCDDDDIGLFCARYICLRLRVRLTFWSRNYFLKFGTPCI
jgi:hypothetical protein